MLTAYSEDVDIVINLTNSDRTSEGLEEDSHWAEQDDTHTKRDTFISLNTTAGGLSGVGAFPSSSGGVGVGDGCSFASSAAFPVTATPLFSHPESLPQAAGNAYSVSDGNGEGEHALSGARYGTSLHLRNDDIEVSDEGSMFTERYNELSLASAHLALGLVADVTYKAALKQHAWELWVRQVQLREAHRRHQLLLAIEYHARNTRYLFFRAWQWRFHARERRRRLQEQSDAMAIRCQCRRTLDRWRRFVTLQKTQRHVANDLGRQKDEAVLSSAWQRWRRWSEHQSLAAALSAVTAQTLQASCFQRWKDFMFRKRRHQLMINAARLHTPAAWGQESAVSDDPAFSTSLLLLRSCWIQWLRVAGCRRGHRLHQHALQVAYLSAKRERELRAAVWQRWLLHTVSTVQARQHIRRMRLSYYQKWTALVNATKMADSISEAVAERNRQRLFEIWHAKAMARRTQKQCEQAATVHYRTIVITNRVRGTLQQWKRKWEHRQRDRYLSAVGSQARNELLRVLGIRRLVEGVLLNTDAMEASKTDDTAGGSLGPLRGRGQKMAAPLPLRPLPAPTAESSMPIAGELAPLPLPPLSAVASAACPETRERATSPIPLPASPSSRKMDMGTQTDSAKAKANAKALQLQRQGRLSLVLHGRAQPSFLLSSDSSATGGPPSPHWDTLSAAELQLQGKGLLHAYRAMKASAAEEAKEVILLGLKMEQLQVVFTQQQQGDEEELGGEDDFTDVKGKLNELKLRRDFLLVRDAQRRRLYDRVQELMTELERRSKQCA